MTNGKEQGSLISQAQMVKRVVFDEGRPMVVECQVISLALGISMERLHRLEERHRNDELVIFPLKGRFYIGIKPSTEEWRREALEELVNYFTAQRREKVQAKQAYRNAYTSLQRRTKQEGFVMESDYGFAQQILRDLWDELSEPEKRNLSSGGIAPENVFSSMGVID